MKLISYNDCFKKEKDRYMDLLNKTEAGYKEYHIEELMACGFRLLDALELMRRVKLFNSMPEHVFSELQNLRAFESKMGQIKNYFSCASEILDIAATIQTYYNAVRTINAHAEKSAFLDDSYKIQVNEDMRTIVGELLSLAPSISNEMVKIYHDAILRSAVYVLSVEDLIVLDSSGYLTSEKMISIMKEAQTEEMYDKLNRYYASIGKGEFVTEEIKSKLVGVSFPNDDGSSRQDYLSNLSKAMESSPQDITIEQYLFHNASGQDEPAAKVLWQNKCIGNIPAALMAELVTKYTDPVITGKISSIGKSDNTQYIGASLELTVRGIKRPVMKIANIISKHSETEKDASEPVEEIEK